MIFAKQIRLILLVPVLFTSVVVIALTIAPWYSSQMRVVDRVQQNLLASKVSTMQIYTWSTTATVSALFQLLASRQTAVSNLLLKVSQGQVHASPAYQEQSLNILDNSTLHWTTQNQDHLVYASGYYSPYSTDRSSIPQAALFDASEFLLKAFHSVHDNVDFYENQYYLISQPDGSSLVVPVMYLPPTPSLQLLKQYDDYYANCSYNHTREYFYEFRCLPSFTSAIQDNQTNVIFNLPVLEVKQKKIAIKSQLCSRIDFTPSNSSVICSVYTTQAFVLQQQKKKDWRTYVVYTGTRSPILYEKVMNNATLLAKNIEDLEYDGVGFIKEKQDYLQKTRMFEYEYNYRNGCDYQDRSKAQDFYISKNGQKYQLFIRNLTICTRGKFGDQQQILGTIVNEASVIDEELSVFLITVKINKYIQISIGACLILLILTAFATNFYSLRLVAQITNPIDELIFHLRNIDEGNIEQYFAEYLQGAKKDDTPYEMELLIRSVYDFVGIVRNAYQHLADGNDFEALMGYSAAFSFYEQNENTMGLGVILNNIGVIHVTHKRFLEAAIAFHKSVEYINYEKQKYEDKYFYYGITEDELYVDLDFKKIESILYHRQFNLAECIVNYLETIPLRFYQTIEKERQISQFSIEFILNQVENDQTLFDSEDVYTLEELKHFHEIVISSSKNEYLTSQEIIQNLWNKVIHYYTTCKETQKKLNLNKSTLILLNFRIINCYLLFQNYNECEILLHINNQLLHESELHNYSLLKQKYYLYLGLYYYKIDQKQQAAMQFTNSLKVEGHYNARDRLQALRYLRKIMVDQVHLIQPLIEKYEPQNKKVIFLVDNTDEMKKERSLIRAIESIKTLINCLQEVQIGYGIINQDYKEMIPLIEKKENYPFIMRMLEYIPLSEPLELDLEFGVLTAKNQLVKDDDCSKKFIIILTRDPVEEAISSELEEELDEKKIEILVMNMRNEGGGNGSGRHKSFRELDALRQYLMSFEIRVENANEYYNIEQTL